MNHRHPIIGETLLFAFSEEDIREGTVLAHSEVEAWPGACDITTEFMIARINGQELTLTRHSILPEEEQDWNVDDSEVMVTIFPLPGPLPVPFLDRLSNAQS